MLANCLEMTGIKICTYKKINADGGNISRDRLREELAKYEATALPIRNSAYSSNCDVTHLSFSKNDYRRKRLTLCRAKLTSSAILNRVLHPENSWAVKGVTLFEGCNSVCSASLVPKYKRDNEALP